MYLYISQVIIICHIFVVGESWSIFTPAHTPTNISERNLSQQRQQPNWIKQHDRFIISGLLSCLALFTPSSDVSAAIEGPLKNNDATNPPLVWHLQNGDVELRKQLSSFKSFSLQNPVLLGSGGGGSVFSARAGESGKDLAVKVSWIRSAASVKRECDILSRLEENGTRNVEKCLGAEQYPQDTRRLMILLDPAVGNTENSVTGVNKDVQALSVQAIVKTMVDMLAANVVTTDVQPLINRETGDVLFIDMTEAQVMSAPPTFLDLALASSFCSEMTAIIPESMGKLASTILLEEVQQALDRGVTFQIEIMDLMMQTKEILNHQ